MALESSGTILYMGKMSYKSGNRLGNYWWGGAKILHTHTKYRCLFYKSFSCEKAEIRLKRTERGGSVVTHETRIREVPGSNPDADQPDWGFFVVFLIQQGKCWVGFSLP